MKETGARIVARTPILAMCFSTSYLLSKCGMPVCRLAEPTEVKTRCTPAALAASAAAIPCRVSASVPPNGVVIAKREVAPSSVFVIAAVSSSDAATSAAPAFASSLAWLEFGSRMTARTLWPRSRRPRATAPPCLPVDPMTTTVSSCVMFGSFLLRSDPRLQARLEQPGKGPSHVDEDHGPQYSHEEGQRKPARGHQGVENKDVDNHRCQHCHRQRYVTVDQQKYTCDDLKREDHPQVMRDIKGTHELSSNAPRRGKGNKVQEAVQPHNKKDHARQISGDCRSGSHNRVLLFDRRHCIGAMYIDINIIDDVYFWEIQVFLTRGNQGTDYVWLVMMKAMRALTRYAAADIEETGLGLSDFGVLEVLLHKGPLPVNTIGPMVDLTPGSISIAVDRLVAKGLVSRVESAEDRRVRIVALTPRGKDLIVSAFRKHSGQMRRVFSELSPEELRGLEVMLKKIGKRAAALMEES